MSANRNTGATQAESPARSTRGSSGSRAGSASLVERERELEQLTAAIAAARDGTGGMVVVEGTAGLGKSRLLRSAVDHANERGVVVLSARGGEAERDFSFGVAVQLLERRLGAASAAERSELLAGAASLALPLFTGEHWDQVRPPDHAGDGGLLHGLFWLVANLAERSPVMLAVDDLHWSDEPTVRFLLYLLPRLAELPLVVVATRRRAEGSPAAGELGDHPFATRIPLAPLSRAAVAGLLEDALGRKVGARFAASCHEATGGNPFLVQAMIHSLRDDRIEPSDDQATRIAELRPEAVRRQLLVRISRVGEDAVALASAAAVLGDETPISHAAAIAELDADAAARAADALVAADVLAQATPISFTHPLVRATVYEELPAAGRARWHVRAARLLHDEHATTEQIASQLLAGSRVGEPWAVEVLREAARGALADGSPEPAIRYLTAALHEPLEREGRVEVLLALAEAKAMIGESSAERDLERALALLADPRARARAHHVLGGVLYRRGELAGAAEHFERALALLGDSHDPIARDLNAAYYSAASLLPDLVPQALQRIGPLLERPAGGESTAERSALAGAAVYQAIAGGPREQAIGLARRAWGDGQLLADEGPDGWAWSLVTGAFSWADDYAASLDVSQAVIAQARRAGSVMAYATASFCAVGPAYMAGRIAESRAHAEAALDARRYGWRTYAAALDAVYALVLIDQDELEQAETALDVLEDPSYGTPPERAWVMAIRGRLRLLQGNAQAALDDLLTAGEGFAAIAGPAASWTPWRPYAALAAHQLGDHGQAAELVDTAVRNAERGRRPVQLAGVLRARAHMEPAGSGELLSQALELLEPTQARTERVRVRAELGAALRRQGRREQARTMLTEALEEAHRIGARRIEREVHQELRIVGARPRRLSFSGADALTASERRVADMAARGLGNREIAQALFVTPRTVEQHLYNSYKKLGISSRRQLGEALSEAEAGPQQ